MTDWTTGTIRKAQTRSVRDELNIKEFRFLLHTFLNRTRARGKTVTVFQHYPAAATVVPEMARATERAIQVIRPSTIDRVAAIEILANSVNSV